MSQKAASASPKPAAKRPAKPIVKRPSKPPGEVRIIGGQWRRTRLAVANKPGLRPTPDRVRETLFNWLGQDLTGWRCLDAFAGTGALGLEAASRGAAPVLLCEQDSQLVEALRAIRTRLQAEGVDIRRMDGVAALREAAPGSLHLVLLDPPFDAGLFVPALKAAARALAPDGFVYLEAPEAWSDTALAEHGFVLQRHLRAGAVHAHLLKPLA
ncbi:16S rRNA (guanine(966)-N(2))-methyltransferase RsmD [Xylophilus sp. GW821-FHT01B05]